jgi:hypothetical protein
MIVILESSIVHHVFSLLGKERQLSMKSNKYLATSKSTEWPSSFTNENEMLLLQVTISRLFF